MQKLIFFFQKNVLLCAAAVLCEYVFVSKKKKSTKYNKKIGWILMGGGKFDQKIKAVLYLFVSSKTSIISMDEFNTIVEYTTKATSILLAIPNRYQEMLDDVMSNIKSDEKTIRRQCGGILKGTFARWCIASPGAYFAFTLSNTFDSENAWSQFTDVK